MSTEGGKKSRRRFRGWIMEGLGIQAKDLRPNLVGRGHSELKCPEKLLPAKHQSQKQIPPRLEWVKMGPPFWWRDLPSCLSLLKMPVRETVSEGDTPDHLVPRDRHGSQPLAGVTQKQHRVSGD